MTQPADRPEPPARPTVPVPQEIPAGWYPDPEGRAQSRYWDGAEWTDQLGPLLPQMQATQPAQQPQQPQPVSDRSRLSAALLCFFLGVLGVHRFYVGKVGTGLLQLFTAGGLGIWWLADLIVILVGGFRDAQRRLLVNW